MNRISLGFKIVGLCTLLACVFGVIHDQITARIYLPYFTVFHPNLGLPNDPSIVALVWGIVATWWVGAILGSLLALACMAGNWAPLKIKDLSKPLAWLFASMTIGALLFGLLGYRFGSTIVSFAFDDARKTSTMEERSRFAADLFAHTSSYFIGFFGGGVVVIWAIAKRFKLSRNVQDIRN